MIHIIVATHGPLATALLESGKWCMAIFLIDRRYV